MNNILRLLLIIPSNAEVAIGDDRDRAEEACLERARDTVEREGYRRDSAELWARRKCHEDPASYPPPADPWGGGAH